MKQIEIIEVQSGDATYLPLLITASIFLDFVLDSSLDSVWIFLWIPLQ